MKKLFFLFVLFNVFQGTLFSQSCLPDGINFNTQDEIDNFHENYPGCSEIEGDVNIQSMSISDLIGLSVITNIGGDLNISCQYLHNLEGLENLTYIGGDLRIFENSLLNDISVLKNLTLIKGALSISYNYSLINLSGLDNITAGSITDLQINNNYALSTCEVQSICDYLASPNGAINIHFNNGGCNNPEEVEAECLVGVEESAVGSRQPEVSIYPNPSSATITIELPEPTPEFQISIFNFSGQEFISQQTSGSRTEIDISQLQQGIYFVRVADDRTVQVGKFVKQ